MRIALSYLTTNARHTRSRQLLNSLQARALSRLFNANIFAIIHNPAIAFVELSLTVAHGALPGTMYLDHNEIDHRGMCDYVSRFKKNIQSIEVNFQLFLYHKLQPNNEFGICQGRMEKA